MNRSPTVERLLYITLFLIFIGVGIAVFVLYWQLHATRVTSNEIQRAVIELKSDKAARDQQVLEHINCIALFLAQPNRAEVRIKDIEQCKIVRE